MKNHRRDRFTFSCRIIFLRLSFIYIYIYIHLVSSFSSKKGASARGTRSFTTKNRAGSRSRGKAREPLERTRSFYRRPDPFSRDRPQLAASNPRGSANGQRTPKAFGFMGTGFSDATSGIFPSNFYRGPRRTGQPNLRPGGHFLDPLPLPLPLPFLLCPTLSPFTPSSVHERSSPRFLVDRASRRWWPSIVERDSWDEFWKRGDAINTRYKPRHGNSRKCFLAKRTQRGKERLTSPPPLKESSSPLRCFTFAFDGESPLGGHAEGEGVMFCKICSRDHSS